METICLTSRFHQLSRNNLHNFFSTLKLHPGTSHPMTIISLKMIPATSTEPLFWTHLSRCCSSAQNSFIYILTWLTCNSPSSSSSKSNLLREALSDLHPGLLLHSPLSPVVGTSPEKQQQAPIPILGSLTPFSS